MKNITAIQIPNTVNVFHFTAIDEDGTRSPATVAMITHDVRPPALFVDGPVVIGRTQDDQGVYQVVRYRLGLPGEEGT